MSICQGMEAMFFNVQNIVMTGVCVIIVNILDSCGG